MNRLLKVIFQLFAAAVFGFVLTATWFLFDGLNDDGNHADVALVPGATEVETGVPWDALKARLDRAVQLYNETQFTKIIVSGIPKAEGANDEADAMQKYLETQGIPEDSIIQDHGANDTHTMVQGVVQIMKDKQYASIMVIAPYYVITRVKTILRLEGINPVQHAHLGRLQKGDAYNLAWNVCAFYDCLGRYYAVPGTEIAAKKVNTEVQKARETVDQKLNSMSE